jgi:dTDP-4-dehydro-6-deoxy-alpha-D-glucopyranose 2,3-dehydratase
MTHENNLKEKIKTFFPNDSKEVEEAIENLIEISKGDSDISHIMKWFQEKRDNCAIKTEEIGINELKNWSVHPENGKIIHDSGKFFSIIGVKVNNAIDREVPSWTQPIMKQQECGILGIISKKIKGVKHYLLYAKYEPGNTHKLQLSPTLQATESNLNLTHGGKKPRFSEYFEDNIKSKVLSSVISVEDGGRFYLKTNKNVIVEIPENELTEIPEEYIWVNSAQLKKLLKIDNVVNSLVRSIIGSS